MPYGDYVYDNPYESGRFRSSYDYSSYHAPESTAYQTDWRGAVSSGTSIFSGILGIIEGFENAKALRESEQALKKAAEQAMGQSRGMARDIYHEGEEFKGAMSTAFGKSGTLMEGSPLLALADTQAEIERNIARAIEQGRIEREALLFQAKQAHRQAGQAEWEGIGNFFGGAMSSIASMA